jgi:NADPH-dependent 2,4-dienoyl-CoA reductase/sulfur reductase-like enzyme
VKTKLSLRKPTERKDRVVVVGAGLAGLRAAERLRELGFAGELVILGAERRRPYHRPALSKQLLTGELRPRDLTLRSYVPLDAYWRRGAHVLKLDPRRHVVELAGDEEIRYDGLVIATGVQARHLPGAPRHDPRVHVLRTMNDAIAIQRSIASGNGKVVVIGGGFTACEVASTARELGCDVTLISRSKVLMGKVVGDRMGADILALHRANDVKVELGANVTNWLCQPWGVSMHLDNGKVVVATTVVLAVGSTPAVQWLRGSGLTLEDGVLCRPTCHVVGAEDIVAAGDVARWPNLRFEAAPRRVEHWMNAVDMGRAAAENLLTGSAGARPFTPLPRFWSEQHGMHLQAAGMPALCQDTVPLALRKDGRGITGYVRNGRLIGIIGQDDPRGMLRWTTELKRELRRPETITMTAIPSEPSLFDPQRPVTEEKPVPKLAAPTVPASDQVKVRRPPHQPQWTELTLEHPTLERFFAQLQPVFDEGPNPSRQGMHPVQRPAQRQRPPQRQPEPPVRRPEPAGRRPEPLEWTQPIPTPPHRSSVDTHRVPLPPKPQQQPQPPQQPQPQPQPSSRAAMAPVARPAQQPVARQQPPSRQRMAPVARPEHPPFSNPQPVARPIPEPAMRPEHPSFPGMRPVPRPHPSLRNPPPVVPPDSLPRHPSMPNMEPVARPLPAFPDMPSLADRFDDDHPSMPNMSPVGRGGMSDFERRREQQLLEWQFRQ